MCDSTNRAVCVSLVVTDAHMTSGRYEGTSSFVPVWKLRRLCTNTPIYFLLLRQKQLEAVYLLVVAHW